MPTSMETATLPAGARVPDGLADVADSLRRRLPEHLDALVDLTRIPSISQAGHDPGEVRRCAEATADLLARSGFEGVRLLEVDGAHPSVTATSPGDDPDAPTVLLYAHHDVQPVSTPANWDTPPFEPAIRGGRLHGRGSSDDKAGIIAHVAAVRAWLDTRGHLPVTVKVLIEGEEEIGSPNLAALLDRHGHDLEADVLVIADLGNFRTGWPGVTWSLRGLVDGTVTVRSMGQPVHSGLWGGLVPDALTGMVRLLATLHDDRGAIAVEDFLGDARGLTDLERARVAALPDDLDDLRREARTVEGLDLLGDPTRGGLERTWFTPAITPIGMSAPDIDEASNTLLDVVTAKLSCRLVPGQDPDAAWAALTAHLRANVPWGLQVEVEQGASAPAWATDPDSAAHRAAAAAFADGYGHDVAWLASGGTIPMVGPFSEAFGGAAALLVGIGDPDSNAHGEHESQDLDDLARTALSLAYLFPRLAQHGAALRSRES